MSEQEIHDICEKYDITNYTINPDGSIDVHNSVDLNGKVLTKIPIKFNNVYGNFDCSYNNLTSLENSPKWIKVSFFCIENRLTSLEGCPISDMHYYFGDNPLKSIDGYNLPYSKLNCSNSDILITKHKRKSKIKYISEL